MLFYPTFISITKKKKFAIYFFVSFHKTIYLQVMVVFAPKFNYEYQSSYTYSEKFQEPITMQVEYLFIFHLIGLNAHKPKCYVKNILPLIILEIQDIPKVRLLPMIDLGKSKEVTDVLKL